MRSRGQRGQASVELVVVLPLIAVLVAAVWQAALAGQAVWLSGAAARAAARAVAVGDDGGRAARAVFPRALARQLVVRTSRDGAVSLSVGIPALVGGARLATVHARARFAPQEPHR